MRLFKSEPGRKRERGSVLAMSALGMLSFLLATGLSVDIGHFYLVKSELQNAADAAALAGASALNSGSAGIQRAKERATAAMNSYEFNSKGLDGTKFNVTFSSSLEGGYVDYATALGQPQSIRFVRVETPSVPVQVFFAAPVLGTSKNLKAEATAGMSIALTGVCDFLPVSVIDYGVPITEGNTYTFRAAPAGGVSPGNYQLLAVAGAGGQDVRVGIASGVNACASPGEEYAVDTKTGVTSGPVRVGINTRFGDYGPQVTPQMQPPDLNVMEGIDYTAYKNGTSKKSSAYPELAVAGRRVVIIPIVKQNEYDPGRNVVKFNRFGLFFLKNKVGSGSGGDLEAEYIQDTTVVGRGKVGTGAPTADGNLTMPVLYK
ncbi:MAG TPA: pilus assembly protein TadG-related protein [Pyrinomonadaceae bacterium]|jgi:Flp pilus assembly protein TadG